MLTESWLTRQCTRGAPSCETCTVAVQLMGSGSTVLQHLGPAVQRHQPGAVVTRQRRHGLVHDTVRHLPHLRPHSVFVAFSRAGGKRDSRRAGGLPSRRGKGPGGSSRGAGALVEGTPLPDNGACKHYRHSYRWLRFPCCGKCGRPCPWPCHWMTLQP
jgi:hypothetical protein